MAQKTALGSLCSFSPIILRPWCGIRLLRMYEYVVFVSRHTYVYAWLLRKVTCVCVVIN